MSKETLEVLRMIEEGKISVEEGQQLLAAMGGGAEADDLPQEDAVSPPESGPAPPEAEPPPVGPPAGWQQIGIYPLVGGIALLAVMGYFTDQVVDSGEKLGWLACTVPLMILGGLAVLLAWWSRGARWLHLRVRDEGKQIKISLPLPLRLAAWLVRLSRPWVPQFRDTAVDELILSLEEMDGEEGILVVQVDEGEEEQVQVFIG